MPRKILVNKTFKPVSYMPRLVNKFAGHCIPNIFAVNQMFLQTNRHFCRHPSLQFYQQTFIEVCRRQGKEEQHERYNQKQLTDQTLLELWFALYMGGSYL